MRRTPNPLPRKLHMPSGVWSYDVGKSGVQIRTPDCEKTVYVGLDKLLGESMRDIKMARDWGSRRDWYSLWPQDYDKPLERTTLGDVTPAKVWQYIACYMGGAIKAAGPKAEPIRIARRAG